MRSLLPIAALALLAPAAAAAIDLADGQLSLHGDGEWSYRRTSGSNSIGLASPEGNYDTAKFDLVLTVRPAPELVLSALLGFDPDGATAEWVFAEWRFSEQARVRVGKIQQPFGNFNELRFAGTTRPFFDLPISVYGPANLVGVSYLGLGLTGDWISESGWTVAWDAYGGAVSLDEFEGYQYLVDVPPPAPGDETVGMEQQQVRDILGGRLSITTPQDLTLRLSGYGGNVSKEAGETGGFYAFGASLQYRTERLGLSAEAFHSVEPGREDSWAGYGIASYFLTEHLQAGLRAEAHRTSVRNFSGDSALLRHTEVAGVLGYWVNPSLVFKGSAHAVVGNRFALPEGADANAVATTDPPAEQTWMFILGTQFAF
jgi:hypothetical protein